MKWMLGLILILGLVGCGGEAAKVADFIPGTYVRASRGEFGLARDTLVITLENGLHYRVERRVGYAAVRHGKVLPARFRREVSGAVYDPEKLELSEPLSGRVFRFDRKRRKLLLNMAAFRKL